MTNPEVARSIRAAGILTNYHDVGRGHWTQIEHAGRFARLVIDFFTEAQ